MSSVASQYFCLTALCLLTAAYPSLGYHFYVSTWVISFSVPGVRAARSRRQQMEKRPQVPGLIAPCVSSCRDQHVRVCVSGPRTSHGKDLGAFIFFPSAFNLMRVDVSAQFANRFHTGLACEQGGNLHLERLKA